VRASHTEGVLLGSTRDDAAGEAFDKGANILGLPYPGGPSISKAAEGGDREAFSFPHPLQNDPSFDFSFSGLKTALKYCVRDLPVPLAGIRRDLAASYEHALCLHLTERIERVMPRYPDVQEVHVVGGVSANGHLRELLCALCPNHQVRFPRRLAYCTDNAAMIAAAGYFLIQEYGDAAAAPFATEASLPLSALGPSHTTGPGGSP
jgi:N6-L-threonylcarbamoyladenine synthase